MSLVRILYINDNFVEGALESCKSNIKNKFENISVNYALTNNQAWEKLQSSAYDVIFYDLGMDVDYEFRFARQMKSFRTSAMLIGTSSYMSYRIGNDDLPKFFDGKFSPTPVTSLFFWKFAKEFGIPIIKKKQ